jgi:protein-arginine kinase activator protein McsA
MRHCYQSYEIFNNTKINNIGTHVLLFIRSKLTDLQDGCQNGESVRMSRCGTTTEQNSYVIRLTCSSVYNTSFVLIKDVYLVYM